MAESRFLYVTYIRAPAQTVWNALIDPAQNRQFWSGYHQESSWEVGADFAIVGAEGKAWDTGKVLAFDPPRHFQVTWLHQHDAAMKAEGGSRHYAETSSTDKYAPTRQFYERAGFKEVARIADFYRPGDGKVVYEKLV